MFDITCGQCGAVYHADIAHVGKHLKCTQCGFIIAIENQPPTLARPEAEHVQTPKHSPAPVKPKVSKSHFRWAVFVGASALVAVSAAIWFWHSPTQSGVRNQQSQVDSGLVQKPEAKAIPSNSPYGPVSSPPPDKSNGVASNPFGSVQGNTGPFDTTQNDQSLATSSGRPLEPRPSHYHSLPTGTRISEDSGVGGHGKLSVSNRTGLDAVVRLYDRSTLETVRWFFVKANSSYAVKSIPQGNYVLAYTTGLDWADSEDAFRWNPS